LLLATGSLCNQQESEVPIQTFDEIRLMSTEQPTEEQQAFADAVFREMKKKIGKEQVNTLKLKKYNNQSKHSLKFLFDTLTEL
jgi:hypothetical protein